MNDRKPLPEMSDVTETAPFRRSDRASRAPRKSSSGDGPISTPLSAHLVASGNAAGNSPPLDNVRHVIGEIVADHGDAGLVVVRSSKRADCCAFTNECRAKRKVLTR